MPSQRLTRQSISTLTVPAGKANVIVFDEELPGFGVKVSAGGSRQFVVQYRPAGERTSKRLTIGSVSKLSLDEARREARKLFARALTGDDPHAAKAAAKVQAAQTVGGAIDAYLAACAKRQKPGTFYQTSLHLTRHWAPLHPISIHKVTRKDVAERLTELAESSGGVSANRSRSALSAMFAWAIEEGRAELNPVVGTRKPAEETPRTRVLTETELRAVWHACRDDSYGRIVKLLILTAQRRDEVGAMREGELDLDAGLWTLPGGKLIERRTTKNKREHIVPLAPAAVTILRETPRIAGRDLMFGEGKSGFSGWSRAKSAMDGRMKAAGAHVTDWTVHDLRRTTATMMADRLNVLPHVIEAVLNHTSGTRAGVAGVYNRATYVTEKRDALERWAIHLSCITAT